MGLSLQELIRRLQQRQFVARETELSLFRENLQLEIGDERRHFVVNVYGQGGAGKSTLLTEYRRLAREAGCQTAWTDQGSEERPDVLHYLASQLGASNALFKGFQEKYERFSRNRQELAADPDFREGLAGLAGSVLGQAGVLLARRTLYWFSGNPTFPVDS